MQVEKVAIIAERNYYITRLQGLCLSKHVGEFSCTEMNIIIQCSSFDNIPFLTFIKTQATFFFLFLTHHYLIKYGEINRIPKT